MARWCMLGQDEGLEGIEIVFDADKLVCAEALTGPGDNFLGLRLNFGSDGGNLEAQSESLSEDFDMSALMERLEACAVGPQRQFLVLPDADNAETLVSEDKLRRLSKMLVRAENLVWAISRGEESCEAKLDTGDEIRLRCGAGEIYRQLSEPFMGARRKAGM